MKNKPECSQYDCVPMLRLLISQCENEMIRMHCEAELDGLFAYMEALEKP